MSKTNMLIRPLKTCDTVPHPFVASVDLPCLETSHFRKCIYMQDCYDVNKQNTHTSLLLLKGDQKASVYLMITIQKVRCDRDFLITLYNVPIYTNSGFVCYNEVCAFCSFTL